MEKFPDWNSLWEEGCAARVLRPPLFMQQKKKKLCMLVLSCKSLSAEVSL
jgi:hypothetical protein